MMTSESESSYSDLKRRVIGLEHQRVTTLQDQNTKCVELEGQVAHLRMLLEQSEASRRENDLKTATLQSEAESRAATQSAEYLALHRSKLELDARLAAEEAKSKDLEAGIARLHKEHEEQAKRFTDTLQQRENELVSAYHQHEEATRTSSTLRQDIAEKTSLAQSLQSRIDRFAEETMTQRGTLNQQVEQLEATIRQNQELIAQTKDQGKELVELRERVEAERTSHLQSKFNCEVIQLRLKDVETSVETEKAARTEATLNVNLLVEQLKDARAKLAEEQTTVRSLSQQLASFTSSSQSTEKTYKKRLQQHEETERQLTKQLSQAQTDCTAVKKDRGEVQSRVTQSSGQLVRLAQHVSTFVHQSSSTLSRKSGGVKQRKISSDTVTDGVIDELITSLSAVARAFEERSAKQATMVASLEGKLRSAADDSSRQQNALSAKDRSVKKCEGQVKDLANQIGVQAAILKERDAQLQKYTKKVSDLQRLLKAQQEKMKEIEVSGDYRRQQEESLEETRNQQLVGLCRRLQSYGEAQQKKRLSRDVATWTEAVSWLESEINSLISTATSCSEKVQHLDVLLEQRNADIKRLHELHEESLSKVTSAADNKELLWQQQRENQEAHMSGLMTEVQKKIQDSHLLLSNTKADLDRARMECDSLRKQHANSQQEAEDLQAQGLALKGVVGLLAGALWPLCMRLNSMTQSLAVASNHSQQLGLAISLSSQLANAISEELVSPSASLSGGGSDTSATTQQRVSKRRSSDVAKRLHPLLRFRKAVIAVVAFNRFCRILNYSSSLCIVRDCPGNTVQRLPVWVCDLQSAHDDESRSDKRHSPAYKQHRQQKLTDWIEFLRHPDFTSAVLSSSDQLTALLQDSTGMRRGRKPSATLQVCARNQLSSIVHNLDGHFARVCLWSVDPEEQWALIHSLQRGLRRCLSNIAKSKSKSSRFRTYEQPVAAISTLHQHIISLANQLQQAEIQSHRHQQKVFELQQALKNANQQFGMTNKRLLTAERKASSLVPVERFDSVCTELQAGLEREKQQQMELAEQRDALLQRKHKLDTVQAEKRRLDTALQQAVRDLQDGNRAVHSTEDTLVRCRQQCSTLQQRETQLQTRIAEVEESLLIVNREKSSLLSYMQTVDTAMNKVKASNLTGEETAKVIKATVGSSRYKLPDGSDFAKCRAALSGMVDVQLLLAKKLDACERDLALMASHIKTLRRELSSACRRQLSEAAVQLAESVVADAEGGYGEVNLSKLSNFLSEQPTAGCQPSGVVPLRGEPDINPKAKQRPAAAGKRTSRRTPRSVRGIGADLSAQLSAAIAST